MIEDVIISFLSSNVENSAVLVLLTCVIVMQRRQLKHQHKIIEYLMQIGNNPPAPPNDLTKN